MPNFLLTIIRYDLDHYFYETNFFDNKYIARNCDNLARLILHIINMIKSKVIKIRCKYLRYITYGIYYNTEIFIISTWYEYGFNNDKY